MIKRRSPRQQNQRTAKVQNESKAETTGAKRKRTAEEKSPKKQKVSDDVHSTGRRKSTATEEKSPNKQRDSEDVWDNYCWKCHKFGVDEKCSTCIRVYCYKCFKGHENQVCEPCLQQNKSEEAFSKIADTSSLLLSVIETSFPESDIKNRRLINWQPKGNEIKLCHIVDYTYIDSKSKDTDGLQYRSPAELLDDVKWMLHNCVIVHGEHHDITKEAKDILKKFISEIDDLSDCAECYRKAFLNICDTPHPLILAKQKSYPPWPAKCLRVVDSKAHVRYFGPKMHYRAKVPLKDCSFVSKDDIKEGNQNPKKKKTKNYMEAEEEFKRYIKLFEKTLGEYPYQPKEDNRNKPCDEELMEMIDKDMKKRVKEKYQRQNTRPKPNEDPTTKPYDTQKARIRGYRNIHNSNIHNARCRIIDLTDEDDCRESKVAVDVISEENEQVQPPSYEDFGNFSFPNSDLLDALSVDPTTSSDMALAGPHIPQSRNTLPLHQYGTVNESGISISNVYSNLNAQDTSFLINDSPPAIQAPSSFGMISSYPAAENNSSVEDDDDCQIVNSDTPTRLSNFKNIDEKLVQAILCRDPAAYTILKMANQLVRHLFIQFWGIANGIQNAPDILAAQQDKIKKLRMEKAKLLTEKQSIHSNYEDRVANADSILRSIKTSYAKKCESLQQKNKELEEKINSITKKSETQQELEAKISDLNNDLANVTNDLYRHKNMLKNMQNCVDGYKVNSFCSNCKKQTNSPPCCFAEGVIIYYCSTKCQKEHENIHSPFCRKESNPWFQKKPETPNGTGDSSGQLFCAQTVERTITIMTKTVENKSPSI